MMIAWIRTILIFFKITEESKFHNSKMIDTATAIILVDPAANIE